MLARLLLWRLLGLAALALAIALGSWFATGGVKQALSRGKPAASRASHAAPPVWPPRALSVGLHGAWAAAPVAGVPVLRLTLGAVLVSAAGICASRAVARRRRDYVRLRVGAYRGDRTGVESLVAMYEALHKRLLQRWWRRLVLGQPSLALEVHVVTGARSGPRAWLAVSCARGSEAADRGGAAPRLSQRPPAAERRRAGRAPCLLRLKKRSGFIGRVKALEPP